MIAENLVRGRYPVGSPSESDLVLLRQQGVGGNVEPLDPDGPGGASLTSGYGNACLINPSAIGLRQILPIHTTSTRLIMGTCVYCS
jgi:hypothetical protein